MGYEVFPRTVKPVVPPAISLNSAGRIGINQTAARLLGLDEGTPVLLLWDRELKSFAIQRAEAGDERAYKVAYNKSSAGFSAKVFLDSIGADYSELRTLPAKWNDETKWVEVQIPGWMLGASVDFQGEQGQMKFRRAYREKGDEQISIGRTAKRGKRAPNIPTEGGKR